MDFLQISQTKLKLTLTKQDLEKRGIKADSMDMENPQAREMVRDILEEVKGKSGFVSTEKMLIKCYPSRDGGCELFVTSLEKPLSACTANRAFLTQKSYPVYRFLDVKALLQAAKAFLNSDEIADSKLYLAPDGSYSLVIISPPDSSFSLHRFCEFCASHATLPEPYIEEHEKCIIKTSALQKLARFA